VLGNKPRLALSPQRVVQAALALAPIIVLVIWQLSPLGQRSARVEFYFERGFLRISEVIAHWKDGLDYVRRNSQSMAYYGIEVFTVTLGLIAGVALLRRYPVEASFSLVVWALTVTSGSPQSMARYMLVLPTTPIFLSQLGRRPIVDRVWTIASVLLLGMSAMLFAFDMWVG
jgi:hypothetical protein